MHEQVGGHRYESQPETCMKRQGIAEALREGIAEEMERDPSVFCIGEDIAVPGGWGGAFTVTLGLEKKFPDRMINTPIAELGFIGVAVGAALMGMRPIADVQYGDFLFLASDQIINNAAKMRYMSGGACKVPLVMRAPDWRHRPRLAARAEHGTLFHGRAGPEGGGRLQRLRRQGNLKAAVRDDNPVLIFEHKLLVRLQRRAAGARRGRRDQRHSRATITSCLWTRPSSAAKART